MRRIAYLPGDGIGPEVLGVARRVLTAAGYAAEWVELPIGWECWRRDGDALPAATLREIRRTQAGLFGAITSKSTIDAERELAPSLQGTGLRYLSPIVRLRQELGLATNLRPVRSLQGNPHALHDGVNLVVFRENTEDVYAGVEAHPFPQGLRQAWIDQGATGVPAAGPDTAVTLRVATRPAVHSICEAAFAHATRENRRLVTLVDKSNVMRATGGFVRSVFQDVAAKYPRIQSEELHIDAACARLVRQPERFDVIVATNLFGDILSELAAELAGGLPMAASANLGPDYGLFEPVHGSAPDIAGRGVANPLGAVLAGAMLARYTGDLAVAGQVEAAVARVVRDGRLPADLGGRSDTVEVETALLGCLESNVTA